MPHPSISELQIKINHLVSQEAVARSGGDIEKADGLKASIEELRVSLQALYDRSKTGYKTEQEGYSHRPEQSADSAVDETIAGKAGAKAKLDSDHVIDGERGEETEAERRARERDSE